MKLLAKTVEERYQTAAGVEADLRRCLAEWEGDGRIDAFPLGARDISDRLLIPEKLYGREREIETLLARFDDVVAHGTTEFVLVSGYSGIGKSSVCGNFEMVEQLVAQLLQRTASKADQAAVYDLNVRLHTVRGEYPQALDKALACLRLFGIDLPAHPSWDAVVAEYETIWRNLDGRPIETLLDLPRMTDPELQAAMLVFSILTEITWFTEFHLHCMLVCRTVNMQRRIAERPART